MTQNNNVDEFGCDPKSVKYEGYFLDHEKVFQYETLQEVLESLTIYIGGCLEYGDVGHSIIYVKGVHPLIIVSVNPVNFIKERVDDEDDDILGELE